MNEIKIICENAGERIDKFISLDGITRTQIKNLIDSGDVTVNGNIVKANYKLKKDDEVCVVIPEAEELNVEPENIPLDIVYEDDELLVVNKPQGMVVHPAAGNYTGTMVNALMYHCKGRLSEINGVIRPGIVHRIDKDTSGLLLVAKTNNAHLSLAEQIKNKTVKRRYICVCEGVIPSNKGIIDAPIGRHPSDRKKMTVTAKNSKHAVTHYEVLERFPNSTYLACELETGRTHQIRVHLKYRGNPIIGDTVYGNAKNPYNLSGQALHAQCIGFNHPVTNEYMEFNVDAPEYFYKLLEELRNEM